MQRICPQDHLRDLFGYAEGVFDSDSNDTCSTCSTVCSVGEISDVDEQNDVIHNEVELELSIRPANGNFQNKQVYDDACNEQVNRR